MLVWKSFRGNDLNNYYVMLEVSYYLNIEFSFANIINSFVIKHKNNMSVFKKKGVEGMDL